MRRGPSVRRLNGPLWRDTGAACGALTPGNFYGAVTAQVPLS